MTTAALVGLGIGFVVGQWVGLWLLWRLVRTFGSYTDLLVETHRQNIVIQERQQAMVQDLNRRHLKESA